MTQTHREEKLQEVATFVHCLRTATLLAHAHKNNHCYVYDTNFTGAVVRKEKLVLCLFLDSTPTANNLEE